MQIVAPNNTYTNGLVWIRNDASKPRLSDQVTNGAFTSDLSGWTSTGWTWSSGTALHSTGNTNALSQDVGEQANRSYELIFTVSGRTAGSVTPSLGGTSGTAISSNTTSTQTIMPVNSTGDLAFSPTTDFDGALDNITLKMYDPIMVDLSGLTVRQSPASQTKLATVAHNSTGDPLHVIADSVVSGHDMVIDLLSAGLPASIAGRIGQISTPSQITANQTNYFPSSRSIWRLSSDASRTIFGLHPNFPVVLVNVGSQNIILANQSSSETTARNRIITGTGADVTLAADDTVELVYDVTTQRWRIINTH